MTSAAAIGFPSWTPPSLSTLTFGSNCTVTRTFLESWFDMTSYKHVDNMPDDKINATFWVPPTVEASTTEKYFRDALPSDLQAVASYGQILEWERSLRGSYADAVTKFLNRTIGLNQTGVDALPPLVTVPYFEHVIHAPSRACKETVCGLGFDWEKLGDINGPGVFIYYILLLVIGLIYFIIAFCDAAMLPIRARHSRIPRPPSRSILGKLLATAKQSFSGFSDNVAVFSLALPIAMGFNYWMVGGVRLSPSKDLMLELWVLLYALCVCFWFYRIGACIRHTELAKHRAMGDESARQSMKRGLPMEPLLMLSAVAFTLVVSSFVADQTVALRPRPFKLEAFWDDMCDYGDLMSKRDLIIAASVLAGHYILRLVLGIIYNCAVSPRMKRIFGGFGARVLRDKERAQTNETAGELERRRTISRWHDRWAFAMSMLDVAVFASGSVVILWFYYRQRNQLSRRTEFNSFGDGWTLGQILALSSMSPVLIGCINTYSEIEDESPPQEGSSHEP